MSTLHMGITIEYLEELPDEILSTVLRSDAGPLSAADARAHLAELRARGFELVPSCPKYDEKGRCECWRKEPA